MSDSRKEFYPESNLPSAWDYAYEWNSPMGLRRSFDYRPYNGAKPDRHISLFTEEQMIAHAQVARRVALEEAHEEAAKMAWNASRFMALEEAARVCEGIDDGMGGRISAAAGWCADAIRALAAQTGKEGK